MNETEPCAACGGSQRTFFRNLAGAYCCEDCAGMEVDRFKQVAARRLALAKPTPAVEFYATMPSGELPGTLPDGTLVTENDGARNTFQLFGVTLRGERYHAKRFVHESGRTIGGDCTFRAADIRWETVRRPSAIEQPEGGEFKASQAVCCLCDEPSCPDPRPGYSGSPHFDPHEQGLGKLHFCAHHWTTRYTAKERDAILGRRGQPAPEAVKPTGHYGWSSKPTDEEYKRAEQNIAAMQATKDAAYRQKVAALTLDMDRPSAERRRRVDRRGMPVGEWTEFVSTRHAR